MEELCVLPRPPLAPVPDRLQPSLWEQRFAGHYLNLAGLGLLLAGLLSFMKRSSVSGGYLQCLAGVALGGLLLGSGELLYRRGVRQYAQALLAGGLGVTLMTTCAAHFYYELIGTQWLFAGLVGVVAASGLAVYRYDSRWLGNVVLAGLFLAPFLMKFGFEHFRVIFAYLVAVNVGITLVAFYKRWDFQLLACLLGSYALYFHFFALAPPEFSILFLGVVYGLFLISNNVLHFWRTSTSDFNIGLSYVNPTVFAVVSYCVLERMSNLVPVAVYVGLGAVHLALARAARRRLTLDPKFGDIATNNLIMGLGFLTASVSFINHFYDLRDTASYIVPATLLWFLLAGIFLECRGRLVRRYSFACVALTLGQQLVVIPEMLEGPEKLGLRVASFLFYGVYAWRLYRRAEAPEDLGVALASLGAGLGLLGWLSLGMVDPLVTLAGLALLLSLAPPLAPCAVLPATLSLCLAVLTVPALPTLIAGTLLLAALAWRDRSGLPSLLALTMLLRTLAALGMLDYVAAGLVVAGLLWYARGLPLSLVLGVLGAAATVGCLMWPVPLPAVMLTVALCQMLAARHCRSQFLEALSLAVLMKATLGYGQYTTLAWAVAALAGLARAPQVGVTVLFLAFLKSCALDTGVFSVWGTLTGGEMLAGMSLAASLLLASRVAPQEDQRTLLTLLGLVNFAFQATLVLFNVYGILDSFQLILSGFWCATGVLFVAFGLRARAPVPRLFGLGIEVASALKICVVDLWVLQPIGQSPTLAVLGALLMATAFLYQRFRP